MRLERIVARGFRNLEDLDRSVPPEGIVLLGANGQGKTNFLEAAYYPVLFRSLRGAPDQAVARFDGVGFHVAADVASGGRTRQLGATWLRGPRRKRLHVDGAETLRITDAVGAWVAVAFLPGDVALAAGSAGERRQYLDRMLSLASREYLRALVRYRAALAQRNSALRLGRADLAEAFDVPLGQSGAEVMRQRLEWTTGASRQFAAELESFGETGAGALRYRSRPELADAAGWPEALGAVRDRDLARGLTTVGPHRDDIVLEVGGRELRACGSTGQHRSAAIALKLVELDTLASARGEEPALILDDVFAELDRGRQDRLAARLIRPEVRQVFLSAPRHDELPGRLDLPVWEVHNGHVGGTAR